MAGRPNGGKRRRQIHCGVERKTSGDEGSVVHGVKLHEEPICLRVTFVPRHGSPPPVAKDSWPVSAFN